MKTLQERMKDMNPYFRGIEVYNNALIVKVVFPSNWKYFQSTDERIKVAPSDDDPNLIYYYADSSDTSYEDLFDIIEETIKVNLDTTLKLKLLKDKVEELREIFSTHPYDELVNLSFVFTKPEKQKRKYNKKKTKAEDVTEEPTNNDEENKEE
jgi:hypothetical protein